MIKLNCQKEKSTKEKDILTNFLFLNVYQTFIKISGKYSLRSINVIYYYLIIPMHDQQSSASMDSDT